MAKRQDFLHPPASTELTEVQLETWLLRNCSRHPFTPNQFFQFLCHHGFQFETAGDYCEFVLSLNNLAKRGLVHTASFVSFSLRAAEVTETTIENTDTHFISFVPVFVIGAPPDHN